MSASDHDINLQIQVVFSQMTHKWKSLFYLVHDMEPEDAPGISKQLMASYRQNPTIFNTADGWKAFFKQWFEQSDLQSKIWVAVKLYRFNEPSFESLIHEQNLLTLDNLLSQQEHFYKQNREDLVAFLILLYQHLLHCDQIPEVIKILNQMTADTRFKIPYSFNINQLRIRLANKIEDYQQAQSADPFETMVKDAKIRFQNIPNIKTTPIMFVRRSPLSAENKKTAVDRFIQQFDENSKHPDQLSEILNDCVAVASTYEWEVNDPRLVAVIFETMNPQVVIDIIFPRLTCAPKNTFMAIGDHLVNHYFDLIKKYCEQNCDYAVLAWLSERIFLTSIAHTRTFDFSQVTSLECSHKNIEILRVLPNSARFQLFEQVMNHDHNFYHDKILAHGELIELYTLTLVTMENIDDTWEMIASLRKDYIHQILVKHKKYNSEANINAHFVFGEYRQLLQLKSTSSTEQTTNRTTKTHLMSSRLAVQTLTLLKLISDHFFEQLNKYTHDHQLAENMLAASSSSSSQFYPTEDFNVSTLFELTASLSILQSEEISAPDFQSHEKENFCNHLYQEIIAKHHRHQQLLDYVMERCNDTADPYLILFFNAAIKSDYKIIIDLLRQQLDNDPSTIFNLLKFIKNNNDKINQKLQKTYQDAIIDLVNDCIQKSKIQTALSLIHRSHQLMLPEEIQALVHEITEQFKQQTHNAVSEQQLKDFINNILMNNGIRDKTSTLCSFIAGVDRDYYGVLIDLIFENKIEAYKTPLIHALCQIYPNLILDKLMALRGDEKQFLFFELAIKELGIDVVLTFNIFNTELLQDLCDLSVEQFDIVGKVLAKLPRDLDLIMTTLAKHPQLINQQGLIQWVNDSLFEIISTNDTESFRETFIIFLNQLNEIYDKHFRFSKVSDEAMNSLRHFILQAIDFVFEIMPIERHLLLTLIDMAKATNTQFNHADFTEEKLIAFVTAELSNYLESGEFESMFIHFAENPLFANNADFMKRVSKLIDEDYSTVKIIDGFLKKLSTNSLHAKESDLFKYLIKQESFRNFFFSLDEEKQQNYLLPLCRHYGSKLIFKALLANDKPSLLLKILAIEQKTNQRFLSDQIDDYAIIQNLLAENPSITLNKSSLEKIGTLLTEEKISLNELSDLLVKLYKNGQRGTAMDGLISRLLDARHDEDSLCHLIEKFGIQILMWRYKDSTVLAETIHFSQSNNVTRTIRILKNEFHRLSSNEKKQLLDHINATQMNYLNAAIIAANVDWIDTLVNLPWGTDASGKLNVIDVNYGAFKCNHTGEEYSHLIQIILLRNQPNHADKKDLYLKAATSLIEYAHTDINFTTPNNGMSALHLAASYGDLALVEILLKHKNILIDLSLGGENNQLQHPRTTALDIAIYFNHFSVVQCLVENGCNFTNFRSHNLPNGLQGIYSPIELATHSPQMFSWFFGNFAMDKQRRSPNNISGSELETNLTSNDHDQWLGVTISRLLSFCIDNNNLVGIELLADVARAAIDKYEIMKNNHIEWQVEKPGNALHRAIYHAHIDATRLLISYHPQKLDLPQISIESHAENFIPIMDWIDTLIDEESDLDKKIRLIEIKKIMLDFKNPESSINLNNKRLSAFFDKLANFENLAHFTDEELDFVINCHDTKLDWRYHVNDPNSRITRSMLVSNPRMIDIVKMEFQLRQNKFEMFFTADNMTLLTSGVDDNNADVIAFLDFVIEASGREDVDGITACDYPISDRLAIQFNQIHRSVDQQQTKSQDGMQKNAISDKQRIKFQKSLNAIWLSLIQTPGISAILLSNELRREIKKLKPSIARIKILMTHLLDKNDTLSQKNWANLQWQLTQLKLMPMRLAGCKMPIADAQKELTALIQAIECNVIALMFLPRGNQKIKIDFTGKTLVSDFFNYYRQSSAYPQVASVSDKSFDQCRADGFSLTKSDQSEYDDEASIPACSY